MHQYHISRVWDKQCEMKTVCVYVLTFVCEYTAQNPYATETQNGKLSKPEKENDKQSPQPRNNINIKVILMV